MSEPEAPVGITGATGRLGSRVAERLATQGVRQRFLVRDLARAPRLAQKKMRVPSLTIGPGFTLPTCVRRTRLIIRGGGSGNSQ